jgi:hypothetical protein
VTNPFPISIESVRHHIDVITAAIPDDLTRTHIATLVVANQFIGMMIMATELTKMELTPGDLAVITVSAAHMTNQLLDTLPPMKKEDPHGPA